MVHHAAAVVLGLPAHLFGALLSFGGVGIREPVAAFTHLVGQVEAVVGYAHAAQPIEGGVAVGIVGIRTSVEGGELVAAVGIGVVGSVAAARAGEGGDVAVGVVGKRFAVAATVDARAEPPQPVVGVGLQRAVLLLPALLGNVARPAVRQQRLAEGGRDEVVTVRVIVKRRAAL